MEFSRWDGAWSGNLRRCLHEWTTHHHDQDDSCVPSACPGVLVEAGAKLLLYKPIDKERLL